MTVGPSSSATTLDAAAAAAAAAVPAIYSFYNPSSTKRIMIDEERTMQQQDEQQQEPYEVPTYQLTIGLWSQRILGIIVVISSIFMFSLAWKRRDRLFHRLVLGMSIYELIWGGFMIYGAAAVPKETTNAIGNFGSVLTCTIQGFAFYITGLIAIFYYCSFAIYSYVGVLNNFKKINYLWIEKYIHVLVHIYPIASGIYLLTQNNFNNTGYGYCFIQSDPLGCGSEEYPDVVCERGPENKQRLDLFWAIPLILILICTTFIMTILIIKVKRNQNKIRIKATAVIIQTIIYLTALYVGILPSVLFHVLKWFEVPDEAALIADLATYYTFAFFNIWCMLVHRYFSIDSKKKSEKRKKKKAAVAGAATTATTAAAANTANTATKNRDNNNATTQCKNESENLAVNDVDITNNINIFSSGEFVIDDDDDDDDKVNNNNEIQIDTTTKQQESGGGRSSRKWSFNIFDGTNGSGAFADFVHDGDSDDERIDNEQTIKWSAVQDHI